MSLILSTDVLVLLLLNTYKNYGIFQNIINKEALIKSLQVLKAEIATLRSLSRANLGTPRNDNKIKSLRAHEPLAASEAWREAISKLESCTKYTYSEAP